MSIFVKIALSLLPLVTNLENVPLSGIVGQSPRTYGCVIFPPYPLEKLNQFRVICKV